MYCKTVGAVLEGMSSMQALLLKNQTRSMADPYEAVHGSRELRIGKIE